MSEDAPATPRVATIGAIERALEVLTLFAESDAPSLGVTEIADRLGYSKAVVHRILTTCTQKNFVEVDPRSRRYALGPQFVALGLSYLDRIDVRARARPTLVRLSEATFETATLSIKSGWGRVYVDQVTPDRDVKMVVQLGSSFPLHAGASSKALLAFLPEAEQTAYIGRGDLPALTELTITDRDELVEALREIRFRGYAISYGERHTGAGSIAAPVFGHNATVVAVLSIAGPIDRFRSGVDRFTDLLLDAAQALTRVMGGLERSPRSSLDDG